MEIMGSTDLLAGVISSELCWSASGNELRVHTTESLSSHVGHGTSGLPTLAMFQFFSKPAAKSFESLPGTDTARETVRQTPPPWMCRLFSSPRTHSGDRPSLETTNHLSRPGSASAPVERGKLTIRAVSGTKMPNGRTVLVCLVSEHGLASEVHCLDPTSGETLHIAADLPTMLTSLAVLPRRFAAPPLSTELGCMMTGRLGRVGSQHDSGPAAGAVEDMDVDCSDEVVVVVGGLGGRVRLVSMRIDRDNSCSNPPGRRARQFIARQPRVPGNLPSEREGIPVSALEAFMVRGDGAHHTIMVAVGWEDGHWAVSRCYEYVPGRAAPERDGPVDHGGGGWKEAFPSVNLATGFTSDIGPPLHFVYQGDVHWWEPASTAPHHTFRLWLGAANGLMCFELAETRHSSLPQVVAPLVTHQRALIPGAPPQFLCSRAIGGGPPIPLLAFASLLAAGGSPVLVVLDASKGTGVGAGVATSPSSKTPSTMPMAGLQPIEEIELSVRCCPNSIVSGNPHSVWVSPYEVNSFVGSANASPRKISLEMSVFIAEASPSEAGGPRLRAWKHAHVGAAHRVGGALERLGLRAFCDTSKEHWNAVTTRSIDALGHACLEHIIGDGRDGLWGKRYRSSALGFDEEATSQASILTGAGAGGVKSRTSPLSHDASPGGGGGNGGVPRSTLMLAARLQGMLALGYGPTIARALTATVRVSEGGGWKLVDALPVQEWAMSAALGAWEEARDLVTNRSLTSSSRKLMESLDAVAGRGRELERILEASTGRCHLYCENARKAAVTWARLRPGAERLAAALRVAEDQQAEVAPLQRRLQWATLAARMALRVASAGLWLLRAGGWLHGSWEGSATEQARNCLVERRVDGTRGTLDETALLWAGCTSLREAPLINWLEDRVGMREACGWGADSEAAAGLEGSRNGNRGSVLAHVTLLAGAAFEAANGVIRDGAGSNQEAEEEKAANAVARQLDQGLAVLAYSILTHMARHQEVEEAEASSDSKRCCAGSAREARRKDRSPFGREAEEFFLIFCNQVRLSPRCRAQSRLAWLLDHGEVSAAKRPLISPWTMVTQCESSDAGCAMDVEEGLEDTTRRGSPGSSSISKRKHGHGASDAWYSAGGPERTSCFCAGDCQQRNVRRRYSSSPFFLHATRCREPSPPPLLDPKRRSYLRNSGSYPWGEKATALSRTPVSHHPLSRAMLERRVDGIGGDTAGEGTLESMPVLILSLPDGRKPTEADFMVKRERVEPVATSERVEPVATSERVEPVATSTVFEVLPVEEEDQGERTTLWENLRRRFQWQRRGWWPL